MSTIEGGARPEDRHPEGITTDFREIPVENPATGEVIRTVPNLGPDQVAELARKGRAVQPAWEALGFEGRAQVLRRCQKWILDNGERVAATIVAETGKTWEDALVTEIGYTAGAFGYWAKHAPGYLADERVRSSNPFVVGKKLVVRYQPLGLVGVIGPWNFPLINSFGDCIPALAAGNSVILKPSEITPLTSLVMADMLRECGAPEHVYQVATGDGETGAALTDVVDYLMFTGSTATGRKVMARAAQTLTAVGLELGGKDPMIVLRDADLDRAANAATYYALNNAGQVCISIERVYVEAPVHDAFVAKVAERVGRLRQGRSTRPGEADVGAIICPRQGDPIEERVGDAVAECARNGADGHARRGRGRYGEPIELVAVRPPKRVVTEKTFGPTLPTMKVAG